MSNVEASNEYRVGDRDGRPWGDWAVLDVGPGYCVKRLRVAPGGVLSLQRHEHRAEQWIVVSGVATVTLNHDRIDLHPEQSVAIARGVIHRLANHGTADVVVIEVQTGRRLSEDDIERLEDTYGRI